MARRPVPPGLAPLVGSLMEEQGLKTPADIDAATGRRVKGRTFARVLEGKRGLEAHEITILAPILGIAPEELFKAAVAVKPARVVPRWPDWRRTILQHPDLKDVPERARRLAIESLELWLGPR